MTVQMTPLDLVARYARSHDQARKLADLDEAELSARLLKRAFADYGLVVSAPSIAAAIAAVEMCGSAPDHVFEGLELMAARLLRGLPMPDGEPWTW